MKLKRIRAGDHANIYVVSPYESIDSRHLAEFVCWLDQHFPNAYQLDRGYLTIAPEAETFLALTFEFVT